MVTSNEQIKVIERGNIYFLYQPKVEQEEAESRSDVQRFYLVLSPHGKKRYRRIVVGEKRLPETGDGGTKNWAFIDVVTSDPKKIEETFEETTYQTKTRGERVEPAARPAGEGVYAVARHGDHTHLLYALELPQDGGEAQKELRINEEGSYIISVKNPEAPSPPNASLGRGQKADFPRNLNEQFHGRKFVPVDPPEFLDHEGAELLLIGASGDVSGELGIELDAQQETERTAEIFSDLRLRKTEHPLEPLFQGKWK